LFADTRRKEAAMVTEQQAAALDRTRELFHKLLTTIAQTETLGEIDHSALGKVRGRSIMPNLITPIATKEISRDRHLLKDGEDTDLEAMLCEVNDDIKLIKYILSSNLVQDAKQKKLLCSYLRDYKGIAHSIHKQTASKYRRGGNKSKRAKYVNR
jgi:hypothetical protein